MIHLYRFRSSQYLPKFLFIFQSYLCDIIYVDKSSAHIFFVIFEVYI